MALNNSQYDEIMREYQRRQAADRQRLDERTKKALAAVPSLRELNGRITALSVARARKELN